MLAKSLAATLLSAAGVAAGPVSPPFGISLHAEGYPVLVLTSIRAAATHEQLVFERPSAYTPVKAYIDSGRNSNDFLNYYNHTNALYSVYFAEVGNNYGTKTPVLAVQGTDAGRTGWSVTNTTNGVLFAHQNAALEHFFACNTTVNGDAQFGLFWGVYNSTGDSGLQPPAGCVVAELRTSRYVQQ